MGKLDDLHTLLRLLKEFEFPVSPILEYAINEKIEQLSLDDERPNVVTIVEVQENKGILKASAQSTTRNNKKHSVLRITRANGTRIECQKSATAFCQAIKEIGVEKVYSLKIPMDNMSLITIGGNMQYPSAQHELGNGYFVNVHSNTATKKRQLERIFNAFNLSWKVEIIESN